MQLGWRHSTLLPGCQEVSKDQVTDAPNIDTDAHISEGEKDALRQYYSGYLGIAEKDQR